MPSRLRLGSTTAPTWMARAVVLAKAEAEAGAETAAEAVR
jgi:hypothetical protein